MFFSIISPQNPPKLVKWNKKIPTREQNFPTNGLLGGRSAPPAPPLASALEKSPAIMKPLWNKDVWPRVVLVLQSIFHLAETTATQAEKLFQEFVLFDA